MNSKVFGALCIVGGILLVVWMIGIELRTEGDTFEVSVPGILLGIGAVATGIWFLRN